MEGKGNSLSEVSVDCHPGRYVRRVRLAREVELIELSGSAVVEAQRSGLFR